MGDFFKAAVTTLAGLMLASMMICICVGANEDSNRPYNADPYAYYQARLDDGEDVSDVACGIIYARLTGSMTQEQYDELSARADEMQGW